MIILVIFDMHVVLKLLLLLFFIEKKWSLFLNKIRPKLE